jgi:hypothetical protein
MMTAHIEACARCRALDAGYRRLLDALRETPASIAPSAGYTERLVAVCEDALVSGRLSGARQLPDRPALSRHAVWPTAAAALLLLGFGLRTLIDSRPVAAPEKSVVTAPDRPLSDSLLNATSATLSLARTTSLPAARAGRYLMASATEIAPPVPLAKAAPQPQRVIRAIGSRFVTGVRPISDSARRAFGFLVDPQPDRSMESGTRRRGA